MPQDKAAERKRYWESAPALEQADMDAMLSALEIAPQTVQGAQNRAEAAAEGAGARRTARTGEASPPRKTRQKRKIRRLRRNPRKRERLPQRKQKSRRKKAELSLKSATANELQKEREQ